MPKVNFTKEQELAIKEKGSVLVSAAAGSGKTAVLVERIINRICDKENPVSADRFLVVTFTKAAAREMKTRLIKRMAEVCRDDADNSALMRQKYLLQSSNICTIDSFCIDLVRKNFEKVGVNPDFDIDEGSTSSTLYTGVLNELTEKYFNDNDPSFLELIELFGAAFDESKFKNAVIKLYEFASKLPFPEKWFDLVAGKYSDDNFDYWKNGLFIPAKRILNNIKDAYTALSKNISSASPRAKNIFATYDFCTEAIPNLEKAIFENNFSDVRDLIFDRKEAISSGVNVPACISNYINSQLKRLSDLFFGDYDTVKAKYIKTAPYIRKLISVSKEYYISLRAKMIENNSLSFNMIEHLAFELLCTENEKGETVKTEYADSIISAYDEVLVDEYQDVNALQDMLFEAISDNRKNLFVVGDLKQSIYAFRGSDPKKFIEKKNSYTKITEENGGDFSKRIDLNQNFRSRKEICDFTNFMFSKLMTAENTGIDYKSDERLNLGAKFPETKNPKVEIHYIYSPSDKENTLYDAYDTANTVLNLVNGEEIIADKGDKENKEESKRLKRPDYSDIAVLLTAAKGVAEKYVEVFNEKGIPVVFSKGIYAKTKEISTMLSLLRVIDNPTDDIELAAVMLSDIFMFTPDDLSVIKCGAERKTSLYSAVLKAANCGDEKCIEFIRKISEYRKLSILLPLTKFISKLYELTGIVNIMSALNLGKQRKANLYLLLEYAAKYSTVSSGTVMGFIKFVKEDESVSSAAAKEANAVTITTVHKSKGLQYPICILANLSRKSDDKYDSVYTDEEYGMGTNFYDEDGSNLTIAYSVIKNKKAKELNEEKLRLFYVAVTRAEEILILNITKHINAKTNKMLEYFTNMSALLSIGDGKITPAVFAGINSFADMATLSILTHPCASKIEMISGIEFCKDITDSKIEIRINSPQFVPTIEKDSEIYPEDVNLIEKINESLNFKYKYESIKNIEAKASVSDIVYKAESGKYDFTKKPAFLSKDGISSADRGTAMHKIMQFIDFKNAKKNLPDELERLKEYEYISESEYASCDRVALSVFFNSDIFERIINSQFVKREMQFITNMTAGELGFTESEDIKDENIVVQGAVDCIFEDAGTLTVLDFKTDRVKDGQALADAYALQLKIYALACSKIYSKPVKKTVIYSFCLGKEIEIQC